MTDYQVINGKLIVKIECDDKTDVEREINRIVGFAESRGQHAEFIGPDLVAGGYVALGRIE